MTFSHGKRVTFCDEHLRPVGSCPLCRLQRVEAERDELLATKERHLATIARLSRESVTEDEAEELRAQAAALTAALGTERAAREEAERRLEVEMANERQVRTEDVGCYESRLGTERTAHAKTREVLRELVEAVHRERLPRDWSIRVANCMDAAEKRLKETGS